MNSLFFLIPINTVTATIYQRWSLFAFAAFLSI